ncbi:hypothetical protein LJD61_12200, partial [Lutispora thermophila]|nr:hypothetical protein [Lutispora saccharofermentans]
NLQGGVAMEDKIDKLYDLVEKMYNSLSGKIINAETNINKRLDNIELTQEQMQTKLEQLAEIQQSHYEENKREHKEIIDKLKRIETATLENETEIYNIKKVK